MEQAPPERKGSWLLVDRNDDLALRESVLSGTAGNDSPVTYLEFGLYQGAGPW